MLDALLQLALFAAKAFIIVAVILIVLLGFMVLIAKAKEKSKERFICKNTNEKYTEIKDYIASQTLPKKSLKHYFKDKKAKEKAKQKRYEPMSNIFVINFHGDIQASAVANLREEVTALLNVLTPKDEVVVRVDSGGGMVSAYGLAAAQLMRFREHNIPLTVTIDKVAASGGYLMACVANKILAAPFSIVGSIGVIVQLPNFHRLLEEKNIDFEQLTAGEFKRTLTMFGENTPEGRKKLQEEIEDVHKAFKTLIAKYRQDINLSQVATGEYWLGEQALALKLVDEIKTSDEYLLERSKEAQVFEFCYEIKKPLLSKLSHAASQACIKLMETLTKKTLA